MATLAVNVPQSSPEAAISTIREEQETYTFKVAVSMALYACLFFVLAFCGPYVLPAITLLSDSPLADRQVAASQLLLLSDTVWVTIPVFFLGAVLFSLLATRRVADALERLGRSAQAWENGELSHRIQFREADSLNHLAQVLNRGWSQVGEGLDVIQEESARVRAAINNVVNGLPVHHPGDPEVGRQLQAATEALDRLGAVLARFEMQPTRKPQR
jgi:HAMP domain-containing protein